MKRLSIIVLTAIVCACSLSAQRSIDVTADVVQFRGAKGLTKWEFQYAFADTAVKYMVAPSGFIGELYCRLEVSSDTGLVHRDEWIASVPSSVAAPSHRQYFSGVRSVDLTPGNYSVAFFAKDVNDTAHKLMTTFKSVVPVRGLRPGLSDVMLVMPKSANERFLRNGVAADPNPRHEVVGSDPALGVYAEVYNAKQGGLGPFDIGVTVLDHVREEQFTTYVPMLDANDGLVLREEFPLIGLPSGVYYVRLQMLSKDHKTVLDTKEERFFLLNPDEPPVARRMLTEDEQFQVSEWAVTTGDALNLQMELSDLFATKAEMDVRKSCSDERAKQRYLFRFWKVRDTDETTMANERLDQLRKDFAFVEKFYRTPLVGAGWKTDRGITRLKYGVPNQIRRSDFVIGERPYETWFYQDIQGGATFYFVDLMRQENYKLVHVAGQGGSTVIGQVREENWFNLYVVEQGSNPNRVNQTPANPGVR